MTTQVHVRNHSLESRTLYLHLRDLPDVMVLTPNRHDPCHDQGGIPDDTYKAPDSIAPPHSLDIGVCVCVCARVYVFVQYIRM